MPTLGRHEILLMNKPDSRRLCFHRSNHIYASFTCPVAYKSVVLVLLILCLNDEVKKEVIAKRRPITNYNSVTILQR
jgi:hypothetical protein